MLKYDFLIQYKKGVTMPADFLSCTPFDEGAASLNEKAIAAAIDPFTPTLVEEQASDSDMIKFKQFVVKSLGHWALQNQTRHALYSYFQSFLHIMVLYGSNLMILKDSILLYTSL